MQIVLATHNAHKCEELKSLLSTLHAEIEPVSKYSALSPEETGLTFIENALIKARFAAKISGKMALADDSGLVVPYLNGEPGIHSARYSGEHGSHEKNIQKLLNELNDAEGEQRNAFFYCVLTFVRHELDPMPIIAEGIWHGVIATELKGKNGFGYDPVFFLPDRHCTAAELDEAEKNKVSHRGIAITELIRKWSLYD